MAYEVSQRARDKVAADASHNADVMQRVPVDCLVRVVHGAKKGTVGTVIKHYKGDYGTRTGGMFTTVLAQCGDKRLVLDIDLIVKV